MLELQPLPHGVQVQIKYPNGNQGIAKPIFIEEIMIAERIILRNVTIYVIEHDDESSILYVGNDILQELGIDPNTVLLNKYNCSEDSEDINEFDAFSMLNADSEVEVNKLMERCKHCNHPQS